MGFGAIAALALWAAGECGLPPLRPGALPWRTGEVLSYDFDVLGIVKAGTVSLEAQRPMFQGTQLPVRARLRNTSVFAKVRRIEGVALSWMDARTLLPERYRDEIVENGVAKNSDARLRAKPDEVTVENRYAGKVESSTFRREAQVLDVLAGAYYLRAADLRPGQALCFDLLATRRYWRVRGAVAPKPERVESPVGVHDALRVDLTVTRADKPEVKRTLHVWIATEPRRYLVAAVTEIDLGPVRLMLASASP
ncbi:MAG TPA: DUF3108 domain-containing protein [Anaeromyxobacteraceae bacterium]|nr:DUF3108 domain-containing protein [Anaeromyxobacteraceae bacterium]